MLKKVKRLAEKRGLGATGTNASTSFTYQFTVHVHSAEFVVHDRKWYATPAPRCAQGSPASPLRARLCAPLCALLRTPLRTPHSVGPKSLSPLRSPAHAALRWVLPVHPAFHEA